MDRQRAPRPRVSPYITPQGLRALKAESAQLWQRRREVVAHLSAAAAEGDRSENAEYIYRKKQLRELDRRIRYLERRLPELKLVERAPGQAPARVYFGATVRLRDGAGTEFLYRIVGADEFDPERNWVSVDSPMAQALLARGIGEVVRVQTPSGAHDYEVVDLRYE